MNYYPRYMGDFQSATMHLSMTEDGAYNRLLDHYYSKCKPLPGELRQLYRIARATEKLEQQAVDVVAEEFFPVGPDGLRHNERADAEIAKWEVMAERNREVGKTGGRPKKKPTGNPSGFPDETQVVSTEKPSGLSVGFEKGVKKGVFGNPDETHEKPSPTPTPTPEKKHQKPTPEQARETRARTREGDPGEAPRETRSGDPAETERNTPEPTQRGVRQYGTALCEIAAPPIVAESAEEWRREPGVNPAALEAWLDHCGKLEPPKVVKPHERLLLAKLLAGHGDADAQLRLVRACSANGWRNVRVTDQVAAANGRGHGRRTIEDYDRESAERLATLPGDDPGPM